MKLEQPRDDATRRHIMTVAELAEFLKVQRKTALVLWVSSLCGAILVLPYVATLENKALAAAAARTRFDVRTLLAISFAQSAVLLAIAVVTGLWASRKLGLETP